MLNDLTCNQISEWEAFNKLEPIGNWRMDLQFAQLQSTITNIFISLYGKKGAKETKADDFMIKWDGVEKVEIKKQSVQDMKSILMALAKASKKNKKKKK